MRISFLINNKNTMFNKLINSVFIRQRTLWRIVRKKERSIAVFDLYTSYLLLYGILAFNYEQYIGKRKLSSGSICQLIAFIFEILGAIKFSLYSRFDLIGDVFKGFVKYRYFFNIIYAIWYVVLVYYRFTIIINERKRKLDFYWYFRPFSKYRKKIILSHYCLDKALFRDFKRLTVAVLCIAEITFLLTNILAIFIIFGAAYQFNKLDNITMFDFIITHIFIVVWEFQAIYFFGSIFYGMYFVFAVNESFVFRINYLCKQIESLIIDRKVNDKTLLNLLKLGNLVFADISGYRANLKYILSLTYVYVPMIYFLAFAGFISTEIISGTTITWKVFAITGFFVCLFLNLSWARIHKYICKRIKLILNY